MQREREREKERERERKREGQTNMTKLMSLSEILRTRLKTRIPYTFRSPASFEKLICAERKLMK
jgi:hypothetical protein